MEQSPKAIDVLNEALKEIGNYFDADLCTGGRPTEEDFVAEFYRSFLERYQLILAPLDVESLYGSMDNGENVVNTIYVLMGFIAGELEKKQRSIKKLPVRK